MMRCPFCHHSAHIRTSRYLSQQTKESYYQCQNIDCSCTFKTIETVSKILCRPMEEESERNSLIQAN
ncbi:ogr/Delta-like zinc finger family protein [Ewingella sp. S1.OA.A_B6]